MLCSMTKIFLLEDLTVQTELKQKVRGKAAYPNT